MYDGFLTRLFLRRPWDVQRAFAFGTACFKLLTSSPRTKTLTLPGVSGREGVKHAGTPDNNFPAGFTVWPRHPFFVRTSDTAEPHFSQDKGETAHNFHFSAAHLRFVRGAVPATGLHHLQPPSAPGARGQKKETQGARLTEPAPPRLAVHTPESEITWYEPHHQFTSHKYHGPVQVADVTSPHLLLWRLFFLYEMK